MLGANENASSLARNGFVGNMQNMKRLFDMCDSEESGMTHLEMYDPGMLLFLQLFNFLTIFFTNSTDHLITFTA